MTYVSQYYHAFSSSRKQEIAGRRIGNLVDLQLTNDQMKADYANRAQNV
jgi:actinin alpha